MVKQAATALTDPTTLKFYGICADKCPLSGSWICNDETTATDAELNECKTAAGGGQFLSLYKYSSSTHSKCSTYMQNCYQLPFGSTDILFRCLYQYNTSIATGVKMCTDPVGIAATSDKCVKTTQASETLKEEPSKPDLIAKQMATVTALFTTYVADVVKAGKVKDIIREKHLLL
jgi:hypothetical protein